MAGYVNTAKGFKMKINPQFVEKATALEPKLFKTEVNPIALVDIKKDKNQNWIVSKIDGYDDLSNRSLEKNKPICLDFGDHQVGYITFKLKVMGSPADAPVYLKLKFGETPCEIGEDSKNYDGWLSNSWIQEELIHIDEAPSIVSLPRRYAFRYMSIEILNVSLKYQIAIEKIYVTAVTSGDVDRIEPLLEIENDLKKIDQVSIKTLQDCMQSVFEDGPKRDRRLWIGDLRLQALANYYTFKNYDLVKRCIYLFAGLTGEEDRVGACLFIKPNLVVDDTVLYDYSLFFISCLYDYYVNTKDIEFIKELWNVAYTQIQLSLERLDEHGLVKDSEDWWCFLDWGDGLNKQAGAQGVLIYTLKQARSLVELVGTREQKRHIENAIELTSKAALKYLWDKEKELFVSGKNKQISCVSQVWMVLAGVLDKNIELKLVDILLNNPQGIPLSTPYMYHYFTQVLIDCNKKEEALQLIHKYWGGMIKEGADTFWELYDPKDKEFSPYGSKIINSYCHAWSCTPTYFIRKYFSKQS